MKKFDFKNIKIRFSKVDIHELNEKTLLLNLYGTQSITLIIAIAIILFQKRNLIHLFAVPENYWFIITGALFAGLVLAADLIISRFVPEEVLDDGGINDKIFRNRPIWHIFVLSLVVAVCEELLFRGALQFALTAYWTSILFAAIHIRYLQSWIMTGLVFGISYGLGWIYIHTGTLWTPIIAHFIIDFIMGCIIRIRREP